MSSFAAAAATAAAADKRYFCHQCSRTVSLPPSSALSCPRCRGGFLEEFVVPAPAPVPVPAFDLLPLLSALIGPADRAPRTNPDAPANPDPDPNAADPLALLHSYIQAVAADVGLVIGAVPTGAAVGDYFVGPGLERLIEELAENDPNRYGTPPAAATAIAALPAVRIPAEGGAGTNEKECAVCMDEFEVGAEATQMPCGHAFHQGCLMPWLELHCSCPVCRHELPTDDPDYESRHTAQAAEGGSGVGLAAAVGPRAGTGAVERRLQVSLPWTFGGMEGSSQEDPRPETGRENRD